VLISLRFQPHAERIITSILPGPGSGTARDTGSLETVVLRCFAKIRLRVWVDVLAFVKTSRSIISAAWLRWLPILHLRSSNQVVYLGSSSLLAERCENSSRERL